MQKSTKGALAAAAAGTLLLGGAGSLAYWTSAQTVSGTTITSGHLKLGTPDCGTGWQLDGTPTTSYTTQRLVPGDTLTKTCTTTVSASGAHLKANFSVDTGAGATGSPALLNEITVTPVYKVNNVVVSGTAVPVANGDVVTVDLTVAWPYGATANNASNVAGGGLTETLDTITVTATQTHSAS